MMMEPRPLRVVNRKAVATTMIRVTTIGRSPPSSALFLMMFSVTRLAHQLTQPCTKDGCPDGAAHTDGAGFKHGGQASVLHSRL